MDADQFEGIRRYVAFDADASATLADFYTHVAPHVPDIIEDFYATIESDPEARAVISGPEQVTRLKRSLEQWLIGALRGPHDLSYVANRKRIGLVHVRINLQQRFMLTAMNRIRLRLEEHVADFHSNDHELQRRVRRALNQLCDIELAIMLDAYHEYLSERIRSAERLATIGQLAATIGHELRNPLGIIESSLFLMKQRSAKLGLNDEQLEKHHEKIQKQVLTCSKIIANLLDLARDRPPKRRREQARVAIQRVIDELSSKVEVQLTVAPELTLDVDLDELSLVLSNLLSNASDAMGGKGTVHISAERFKGGTEIVVQDEGPGVPPEVRDRVFDALFTTKARGTGLGLALCRRIVHAHGGELELVASREGACFRLWFPELPEEPGTAR
jgi:two-component system, NtrC family, sensor histidine kinase HydH